MLNYPISLPPSIIHSVFQGSLLFSLPWGGNSQQKSKKEQSLLSVRVSEFWLCSTCEGRQSSFSVFEWLMEAQCLLETSQLLLSLEQLSSYVYLNLPPRSRRLICSSAAFGTDGFALFLSQKVNCPRKTICGCKRNKKKNLGHITDSWTHHTNAKTLKVGWWKNVDGSNPVQ